jgi:hypothetical protein
MLHALLSKAASMHAWSLVCCVLQVSSISGSDTESSDDDSDEEAAGSSRGRKRDGAAAIQGAQAVFKSAGGAQCGVVFS